MTPLLLALALAAGAPDATLPGGRFGPVTLVRPAGDPARVVLFLSGDGGWELGVRDMAAALARDGALVLGISTPRWVRSTRGERCAYPAGDLEVLAQAAQKHVDLRAYRRPILVGYSSGATLAYAALAQAPAGTFLGAVSLGFCPDLDIPAPFCRGSGLSRTRAASGRGDLLAPGPLAAAWVLLHGRVDQACPLPQTERFSAVARGRVVALDQVGHGFAVQARFLSKLREAVKELDAGAPVAAALTPSAGPAVADLPLVEVPASAAGSAFAVLVTGDGGWAGIDRELAAALAASGLPVVGLDSLKYFWDARTPEGLAADLGRIIEHYAAAWGRPEVALVGYSRGADVIPAAAARLAAAPRARVKAIALLGPGRTTEFELHLADFLTSSSDGHPILPEVERLGTTPVVCLYGREEAGESLCPLLRARPGATVVELAGAHHFGGDYGAVAREVIRALRGDVPSPSAGGAR